MGASFRGEAFVLRVCKALRLTVLFAAMLVLAARTPMVALLFAGEAILIDFLGFDLFGVGPLTE